MGLHRPSSREMANITDRPPVDEEFRRSHPQIYAYLCDDKYETGEKRKRATLTLFAAEGMWKCSLRDVDNARVLFLSAPTMPLLYDALEEALSSSEAVWRADRYTGAPAATRMKKKT